MTKRALALAAALAAFWLGPLPAFASEEDPLGLVAGARFVERVAARGRQGIFTTALTRPGSREGKLSLSVLEFGGKGLEPDVLAISGRYQALNGVWLTARLSERVSRGPLATLGLDWDTGPVAWNLSAATVRASSSGVAPGADLTGTWRF